MNFSTDFRKVLSISFYENPSSGGKVFHADGQTDMTKLIADFRTDTNAHKNELF
jgi:hypothetical protein